MSKILTRRIFHIRINHSLGFFSFYDIEAFHYLEAEIEAKKRFTDDFCNPNNETTFRGVTEKHTLEAYTFDKYL